MATSKLVVFGSVESSKAEVYLAELSIGYSYFDQNLAKDEIYLDITGK